MFGLREAPGANKCFYRYFFALLCFVFFGWAYFLNSPHGYIAALLCGALSRTATRKQWKNPPFAEKYFPRLRADEAQIRN